MFGYVLPEKNLLYLKDYVLYQGIYCGICKSTKQVLGNVARAATNYDSVFLSVLLHNLSGQDFTVKRQNCILHPFRKRGVCLPTALNKDIAVLNVLLLYHKLNDDVIDGGKKLRRLMRTGFSRAYNKAKKLRPDFDEIIIVQYKKLRELEGQRCESIDRVSDCFGTMMQQVCAKLYGGGEHFERLCYNVGRWIFLIDALDDLDSDHARGNYNVLISYYGGYNNRKEFLERHGSDIKQSLFASVNTIKECAAQLDFKFNTDLITNITHRGLAARTEKLMENEGKCQRKIRI